MQMMRRNKQSTTKQEGGSLPRGTHNGLDNPSSAIPTAMDDYKSLSQSQERDGSLSVRTPHLLNVSESLIVTKLPKIPEAAIGKKRSGNH